MDRAKHKVLIVEDEGLIAADLKGRLTAADYDVVGISDEAAEAIQMIRRTSPDLILMDIRIKGKVDGIELAEQVRLELDVPVVYLTAYEDRATLERASRTQAFGYIKKPIASASLKGSIETALAKHAHERALRKERDWARASFEAVPNAVLVTDGEGVITYMNGAAEELTGCGGGQGVGRKSKEVLLLVEQESGRPAEDHVRIVLLTGDPSALPRGLVLKSGSGRRYSIGGSIAPRLDRGQVQGTVVTLTDTTLLEFEEGQLRQERKQLALQRLADGLVQHLPALNAVVEDSARLADALPLDSPLREDAERIEQEALDALALATQVRTFTEQPKVKNRSVRLEEVLGRIQAAWRDLRPALVCSLEPAAARADRWQLIQGLASILLHARAHMDPESELRVETSGAEREPLTRMARIRVTYSSVDENAEAVDCLFEPAWARGSDDLAQVYRVVRGMGGLMEARLERGHQVTLDLYLRGAEAAASGLAVVDASEPLILVVDPNPEALHVVRSNFELEGYKLLEAHDTVEGLLLAELYEGDIPAAVVHARPRESEQVFLQRWNAIRPGAPARFVAVEEPPSTAGGGAASASTPNPAKLEFLAWDMLAWVQDELKYSPAIQ